jgi:hypothetical protein
MSRPVIAHPPLPQPGSLVPPIYARLLRMLLLHADVDGDRVLAAAGLDWATLVTDDKRPPTWAACAASSSTPC